MAELPQRTEQYPENERVIQDFLATNEGSFFQNPSENGYVEDPVGPSYGSINVQEHAKRMCVNKLGHTMIIPTSDANTEPQSYMDLLKANYLRTLTYCTVFGSFGMCVAFLGPILPDFACRFSSAFSTMSWLFFSQSLFILIGCATGGILAKIKGNHVLLLVSSNMIAMTMILIPLCNTFGALAAVVALMGYFMGTIDTVANISMIELYGHRVAPFLQSMHFFYGLGAFISPMIAEPFLLKTSCGTDQSFPGSPGINDSSQKESKRLLKDSGAEEIDKAFWILATLQIPVIILLTILVTKEMFQNNADAKNNFYNMEYMNQFQNSDQKIGNRNKNLENGNENRPKNIENTDNSFEKSSNKEQNKEEIFEKTNKNLQKTDRNLDIQENFKEATKAEDKIFITQSQFIFIVFCTGAILFLYDGLQAGYGAYIYSYAVNSVPDMTNDNAAYLNAYFWGTFAFGRLISIGLATRFLPSCMLICNILGCTFAMALMMSFRTHAGVLYFGTVIYGLFLSSVYPTAVSLAETRIECTATITSIFVVSAALGEMSVPVIVGNLFDTISPDSLFVCGVIMTLLSLFVYALLYYVLKTVKNKTDVDFSGKIKSVLKTVVPKTAEENRENENFEQQYYTLNEDK